jgi:hypothetical protein
MDGPSGIFVFRNGKKNEPLVRGAILEAGNEKQ